MWLGNTGASEVSFSGVHDSVRNNFYHVPAQSALRKCVGLSWEYMVTTRFDTNQNEVIKATAGTEAAWSRGTEGQRPWRWRGGTRGSPTTTCRPHELTTITTNPDVNFEQPMHNISSRWSETTQI